MSVSVAQVKNILSPPLPSEVIDKLLVEYLGIKQNLILQHFSPSELNGGRYAECILRLLEHVDIGTFTPFGQTANSERILNHIPNNTSLNHSLRFHIPRLTRVLLDIRNVRNVAHVGIDVDPNFSDSLLVSQLTDWILIELIRIYYQCLIQDAKKVVESINQVHIPVIFDFNGFLKIQNSLLTIREKILILLYYKKPDIVADKDLLTWTKYKNSSRFKNEILNEIDSEALIHYQNGNCILTSKGIIFVEKYLKLEISV